jgi:glycosyltransferase involved in cell wall biosynthesis
VVTDNGAGTENVLNGETGLLVPPGDPESMARALNQVLNLDALQREAMAKVARRFVAENFTRQLMCARTLDVYSEVLSLPVAGSAAA